MEWNLLVEAELNGVYVDCERKTLEIISTLADTGEKVCIHASDVQDCLVHEMRLSNVIDFIRTFDDKSIDDLLDGRLYFLLNGCLPEQDADLSHAKKLKEIIISGQLVLLEIQPVYGAFILVLAKNFLLRPVL